MAYITKRGSSYSVRYTYQDEHGKSCDKWESFPTKEEAVKRQKQIEHELATGNFLIGHGKHRPCKKCAKVCSHGLQNKKAMKSFDFTAFSGAVKQSKSEPFPFDATSVASSNVMVCVPSL